MTRKIPGDAEILEALRRSRRGPLKPKELARTLDVGTNRYKAFRARLSSLERQGSLYRVKGNRYAVPDKINLRVGRLSVVRSGDGFVAEEDGPGSVFVPSRSLESAMDGDKVVVRIEGRPTGKSPVGRVIKVLERAHETLVGTYHRSRKFGFVRPKAPTTLNEVLIPEGDERNAREGEVVVVRITAYGNRRLGPVGTVETVLGALDDPGVDVLAVIHGHGLPTAFPDHVEAAAEEAARRAQDRGPEYRVDRTDLHVFTIDPSDARDHDDALSVESVGDGVWEVGIHVADVSWFVERGSPLDLEALGRGTSVYLVDRVIPMLPHELSSDACSLLPDQDRLAVSLFATLDERGRVWDKRFERTVIRSRRRLTYEQVEQVLTSGASVDEPTDRSLEILDGLAQTLREARRSRGSLDFDLPESRVVLDDEGQPVDIQQVLRLRSHLLIEDYMLLANEIVAKEGVSKRLPLLYRVHESPANDRLEDVRDLLASLGHTLPKGRVGPKALQKILERVRGKPEEALVSTVILRSMARAHYADKNGGHFGLALKAYAHFTSPIRRYPDLQAHRVVVRALVEGKPVPESWAGEELRSVAEQSSQRERVADGAQRDSIALKKIEFMERHLGDDFAGTVSGVTSFGFFVLLDDFFVEGLVHVNAMRDDYYVFQPNAYALVGERSRRTFRLGDSVRVRVVRADKEERHVDFQLLAAESAV
jgi:ribonuclease R